MPTYYYGFAAVAIVAVIGIAAILRAFRRRR